MREKLNEPKSCELLRLRSGSEMRPRANVDSARMYS